MTKSIREWALYCCLKTNQALAEQAYSNKKAIPSRQGHGHVKRKARGFVTH
jgi:hypothetical protein